MLSGCRGTGRGGLSDLAGSIALGRAGLEHIECLNLFGIAVEVLAFDFDVRHAIAGLALPLAAGGFFLACAHLGRCQRGGTGSDGRTNVRKKLFNLIEICTPVRKKFEIAKADPPELAFKLNARLLPLYNLLTTGRKFHTFESSVVGDASTSKASRSLCQRPSGLALRENAAM